MYVSIFKQYQKQWKNVFHYVKLTDQLLFKARFPKIWTGMQGTKRHIQMFKTHRLTTPRF